MIEPRRIPWVLAAVLAFGACKAEPSADTGASAPTPSTPVPTTPELPRFDRIVRAELPTFGRQPGFVEGGLVYAAIRPQSTVAWLRKIPLPPDAARDLAELAAESGVDWRAEDLQRRFALAPGGVISMTLMRPIDVGASTLRGQLARGGTLLQGLEQVWSELSPSSISVVEPAAIPPVESPTELTPPPEVVEGAEQPIAVPSEPPVALPPSIAAETLEEARELLRTAGGIALHSRMVVPVTDAEPLLQWIRGHVPAPAQAPLATLCPSLPQARLCFADDAFAAIVRSDAHTVTLDLVIFMLETRELLELQQSAIRSAVALAPMQSGRATELRGDVAIELEAPAIVAFAQVTGIRGALSGIRWAHDEIDENVRRRLGGIEAIERLASAPMLFTGARLEAGIGDDDRLQLEARWLAPADRRAENDALLTGTPALAPVPSYAALCDDAVVCARTRGLPRPSTLSDRLATGAWAVDADAFERSFERNDELAALHVLAASWPNLLGAAARWPAMEIGSGPEGAMARNLVDVLGRIEGFGGSVRSVSIGPRLVQADYAVYARTTAADSGIVRGVLSLAGQTMNETTLAAVEGPLFTWTIPEDEIAATIVSRADPAGTATAPAAGMGWIALVDGLDRMSWLLGLPQEPPDGPAAYLELPDLARALPSQPEIERELGFLRGYLGGLRLRAMLDVDAGEPRITAVLSRGAA